MPKSRETKAALEVNAGAICLAGVAVLPHRYVAVPLDFFNLLIEGRLKIRRPFCCLFINNPSLIPQSLECRRIVYAYIEPFRCDIAHIKVSWRYILYIQYNIDHRTLRKRDSEGDGNPFVVVISFRKFNVRSRDIHLPILFFTATLRRSQLADFRLLRFKLGGNGIDKQLKTLDQGHDCNA
nr:MAG TPA: hypothetical protein [Caudoviricetes sp.]